jgi:transposase InsO family protein
MEFLEDKIITRLGVPVKITTNNVKAFSSMEIYTFCFNYGIVLSHSSNHYPQGNGLSESSNKNLKTIIKKTMGDNKKSWDSKIKHALWDDMIIKKEPTCKIPFKLVYRMEVTFPIHLKIPIYQTLQQFSFDHDAVHGRLNQLIEIDESRRNAFYHFTENQERLKENMIKRLAQGLFRNVILSSCGI